MLFCIGVKLGLFILREDRAFENRYWPTEERGQNWRTEKNWMLRSFILCARQGGWEWRGRRPRRRYEDNIKMDVEWCV